MILAQSRPIAFIPTQKPDAARAFYQGKLDLTYESEDEFAVVFRIGEAPGTMLRLVRTARFTAADYTIFGWQVPDLDLALDELIARGVTFVQYDFLHQDRRGIWEAPDGVRVAWFKDPDGNTLSLSQHTAQREV